jgi:pimeloyl-ACP methyl ester carboxylesterase
VIAFDRRGIGLSDPLAAPGPSVLDTGVDDRRAVLDAAGVLDSWVADAGAVLDAAGAGPAVVLANADTGLVALALAAAGPDRVRALVLVHAYARYVRAADYPWGVDPETAAAISADVLSTAPAVERFDPLSHIAPSVASDPAFRRWWDAAGRRAASPATAAMLHGVIRETDVRSRLDAVRAPTLVLHRRSCASCDIGHARHLTDRLAAARLVVLPGADDLWFVGDADALLDEVDAFLDGLGA